MQGVVHSEATAPGAVVWGSQGLGTPPQHASHPTAGGAPPPPLPQSRQAGPPCAIPACSNRTASRRCPAVMTQFWHVVTELPSTAARLPSRGPCMCPQHFMDSRFRCRTDATAETLRLGAARAQAPRDATCVRAMQWAMEAVPCTSDGTADCSPQTRHPQYSCNPTFILHKLATAARCCTCSHHH